MVNSKIINLDWNVIDTVLLDMDGTLLDLHFDNYFWAEYLPKRYAEKNSTTIEKAKKYVQQLSQQTRGTLEWYCLDYWSVALSMDIEALKKQIDGRIAFRPNAIEFLRSLNKRGKRVILATNAHPKTLELKLMKTDFREYFHDLSSSKEIGFAKESEHYWEKFCQQYSVNPKRSLFIDDSLTVLNAAKDYGIGYLLAISQPDSQKPAMDISPFVGLDDFSQLIDYN